MNVATVEAAEVAESVSFVVAGKRLPALLCQKPTIPAVDVIFPVQVRFPEELATVHPVAEEPPPRFISTPPFSSKFRAVALDERVALLPRFSVAVGLYLKWRVTRHQV